ncbi:MAG: hypothetical protein GY747_03805 [Planctomycetes bacterium]|nr:hypothetical protein [Planctomycetota bacterium]MCP4771090.1 hypothetical protein [Planctomycetota bacterium]MCP4861648.1 hypothetical protein [Planctomycetota bacterium]
MDNPEHGTTSVTLADVDADGQLEIVWGAGHSSSGKDIMYVADAATLAIEWESLDLRGPFIGPVRGVMLTAMESMRSFRFPTVRIRVTVPERSWCWNKTAIPRISRKEPCWIALGTASTPSSLSISMAMVNWKSPSCSTVRVLTSSKAMAFSKVRSSDPSVPCAPAPRINGRHAL